MAQGIRKQLLYPLWLLLAGMAVMGLLLVESNLSNQKQEIGKRLERLESAVSRIAIPKTILVLELMRDMSGAELLLLDGFGRVLLDDSGNPLTTLGMRDLGTDNGQGLLETILKESGDDSGDHKMVWKASTYRTRIIAWGPKNPGMATDPTDSPLTTPQKVPHPPNRSGNPPPEGIRVVALIPEQTFFSALWQAARPLLLPLLLGGLVAFTLAAAQANRIMLRIRGIETHTKRISQGDFVPMALPPEKDELRALAQSVNRMAEQLAEFATRLRENERLKLLGQVGAGLAHQLRNATTGAKLALQLHAKSCDSDPEDIQVALKQLDIIERHVGGFLNLGKESNPRWESLHAMQWVQKIIGLTEPIARHFRTTLQFEVKKDRLKTGIMATEGLDHFGDGAQLEHMLQNLITNALEAAGPGGVVKVVLRPNGSREDSPNLEIDILDNGPGVPPEITEKLFTPFATGKPEGVGLGLAVARQVARSHGGDITYSREDGWTRFHVRLTRDNSPRSGQTTAAINHG